MQLNDTRCQTGGISDMNRGDHGSNSNFLTTYFEKKKSSVVSSTLPPTRQANIGLEKPYASKFRNSELQCI